MNDIKQTPEDLIQCDRKANETNHTPIEQHAPLALHSNARAVLCGCEAGFICGSASQPYKAPATVKGHDDLGRALYQTALARPHCLTHRRTQKPGNVPP